MRVFRFWVGLSAVMMAVACPSSEGSMDECLVDGGDHEDCLRALDDGQQPEVSDNDGGDLGAEDPNALLVDYEATCIALMQKTCGTAASSDCIELPACTAAQLLYEHEQERCEAALANDVSYPACEQSACDELLVVACGEGGSEGACADASACALATQWHAQASEGDKAADRQDANAACGAALSDPVVFAPCTP